MTHHTITMGFNRSTISVLKIAIMQTWQLDVLCHWPKTWAARDRLGQYILGGELDMKENYSIYNFPKYIGDKS